jgi:hypothetical protein
MNEFYALIDDHLQQYEPRHPKPSLRYGFDLSRKRAGRG